MLQKKMQLGEDETISNVQTLVGKSLQDQQTLKDINIQNEQTLQLPPPSLPGGQSGPDVIEAIPHEFPFLVSLNVYNYCNRKHICGGTLIGNGEYVMTAAHCMEGCRSVTIDGRNKVECEVMPGVLAWLGVLANAHDLGNPYGSEHIEVADFVSHDDYSSEARAENMIGDIAILKLAHAPRTKAMFRHPDAPKGAPRIPIPWQAASLPSENKRYTEGHPVISPGWGLSRYDGSNFSRCVKEFLHDDKVLAEGPTKLLKSEQYISNLDNQTQTLLYESLLLVPDNDKEKQARFEMIRDSRIPILSPGASTCQGDSGGPLVLRQPDTGVEVIGVLSFGSSNRDVCADICRQTIHGVYEKLVNEGRREFDEEKREFKVDSIVPFRAVEYQNPKINALTKEILKMVHDQCDKERCIHVLQGGGCQRFKVAPSGKRVVDTQTRCSDLNPFNISSMSSSHKKRCKRMIGCEVIDNNEARWKDGPCKPGAIAMFTRVSYFHDWITDKMLLLEERNTEIEAEPAAEPAREA
eukprot:g4717.t1